MARLADWLTKRRPMMVFLLALSVSVPMVAYIQITVSDIRRGLPVEVLRQKHDVSAMLYNLGDLLRVVEVAVAAPDGTKERHGEVLARLTAAEAQLKRVRNTYRFDNLVGASALHAVLDPALRDVRQWLSEGVYGVDPNSPVVMALVRQRLAEAEEQVRHIFDESDNMALDLLQREESRLASFAWAMILVFAISLGLVFLIVAYMARERRSQALARRAEQRLREAVETMADGFALFDAEGRVVITNQRYRDLHPRQGYLLREGFPFETFLRSSVASGEIRDAEEDAGAWLAWRLQHFHAAGEAPFEVTLGDGRIIRINERRTHDGGVSATSSDVTDLRRLSQQLQRNNLLLDAALDNMAQGLAMFDASLNLIICNKRYLELYRLPEEFGRPGVNLRAVLRHCAHNRNEEPGSIDAYVEERAALAQADSESVTFDFLGEDEVLEIRHRPLAQGGSLATYEDVTERYRNQEALRRAKEEAEIASRAKSDFLANISHELRTPLNAIIGFSEILEGELYGKHSDPRYGEYAHDIKDSGRHLLSLINDILDLSKIEAGKYVLNEEGVRLQEVAQSCLRVVGERAQAGGISLTLDIDPELPLLMADLRAMKQILLNLLSNAVKFTPRGGETRIVAYCEPEGSLRLEVRDTGIGMKPENIAQALAPFGQVDSRLSRKYEGTGLGLPLSERLARLHGATLLLESQPGVGTRASVVFPAERVITLRRRPNALVPTG